MTKRRRERDNPEYLNMLHRLIARAGERVADADIEQLTQLMELRRDLDDAILQAVGGLRDNYVTWQDIGSATGTTRKAAQMRWGPKL